MKYEKNILKFGNEVIGKKERRVIDLHQDDIILEYVCNKHIVVLRKIEE